MDACRPWADSLLLRGPRDLAWTRTPLPALGPHDLLLRTRAGAVSLGTELPLYAGTARGHVPAYPLMTGYESLANVVARGAAVEQIAVGERVVAFYGHRTAAVVHESRVVPVPADIPDRLALLLILACDTAKGVSKLSPGPESRVLITGGGPIGLLTLMNLHARGIRDVDLLEPVARRCALAAAFGVRRASHPDDADLLARYTAGFECSSRNSAFARLQEAMQAGSRICVLADGNLEALALAPAFHTKELTIVGSSDGLDYRVYAEWFLPIARSGRYPRAALCEWTIRAPGLPALFAALAGSPDRPVNVLVEYGD